MKSEQPDELRAPDFLIIGAMKAGTTTLHSDLGAHRSIFFPPIKEPADLVRPTIRTPDGVRRYKELFTTARADQLCGEASTHYTQSPVHTGAPEAAMAVAGSGLRLVYLIRDPVERALSHHRHLYSRGLCSANLRAALTDRPEIIHYSRYDAQLDPWLQVYPAEHVAIVRFETYVVDRKNTVEKVLGFLGAASERRWTPGPVRNSSLRRRRPSAALLRIATSRGFFGRMADRTPSWVRTPARSVLSRPVDTTAIETSQSAINYLRSELLTVTNWMERTAVELELRPNATQNEPEHDK